MTVTPNYTLARSGLLVDRELLEKKSSFATKKPPYQDAILILHRLRAIIRENVYQDFLEAFWGVKNSADFAGLLWCDFVASNARGAYDARYKTHRKLPAESE
jgi:hypothetical protein